MELYFDNPLFVFPAVTGPIFIFASVFMMIFPPKKINSIYGYRTSNSMKSQDRWDFAQHYSARKMLMLGILLTVVSVIGLFLDFGKNVGAIIGLALVIITAIVLISNTEKAIKVKFDS